MFTYSPTLVRTSSELRQDFLNSKDYANDHSITRGLITDMMEDTCVKLANVLSELGDRLGLGTLELDQDGGCLLAFDNDLLVDIEQASDGPGFHLSATVCAAPQQKREAVFAELLEANLQGRGTGCACLALDADLDEIVLSQTIAHDDIELEAFEQALEAFLNVLEHWKQRYETGKLGTLHGAVAASNSPIMPPNNNIIRG